MKYYYQHQTNTFLKGEMEELSRYHRDYGCGSTETEALTLSLPYFQKQIEQLKDQKDYCERTIKRFEDKISAAIACIATQSQQK